MGGVECLQKRSNSRVMRRVEQCLDGSRMGEGGMEEEGVLVSTSVTQTAGHHCDSRRRACADLVGRVFVHSGLHVLPHLLQERTLGENTGGGRSVSG